MSTMKLLLAAIFCTAVFVAVDGKTFNFDCISLNVTGTVTVTAKNTKSTVADKKVVIDLSIVKPIITGNCSKPNSVKMTVAFDNTTNWELVFTDDKKMVNLAQSVTFDPADVFNLTSMNESVTVSTAEPLALSADNSSYLCESEQTIAFASKQQGNYSFTVSQDITFMQVQAFGLSKGTFSPAQHCAADEPTTSPPTTPATPPPVPSVKPVKAEMFVVKDSKDVPCFRLKAGLQFAVEYETTDKTMAFSKVMVIPDSANVTGTCATGSANIATMTITNANYSLTITETRATNMSQSAIKLTIVLDPADFPKAADAGKTVSFNITSSFQQTSTNTFYVCDTLQALRFENTNTTLFTNDVQLQAFNLNNGSFSGKGVRCSLDPTPSPLPPADVPGDNTYTVQEGNITCIVLKGEISFSNVTYATKTGSAKANPIVVPTMNETTENVKFSGSCNLEKGNAQQLTITFKKNWTLTLTFARGSTKDSSMLGATADEFRVRDIEFVYYLTSDIFPNASAPDTKAVASQMNITSDFMKGSVNGGSYKCDAEQTEMLDTGVLFQTASLQYKAFNNDNSTSFGDNVSECSADDESNSIVPIAVGAALAGLVAIVLIAYLIGRRRSRRQGYESV